MNYEYIRVGSDRQTVENQRVEIKSFADNNQLQIDGWLEESISDTKTMINANLGSC